MALSPTENRIMDLYDADHPPRVIVKLTGLSYQTVRTICDRYAISEEQDLRADAKIRRQSRKLAQAIAAVGQHQNMPEMKGRYR